MSRFEQVAQAVAEDSYLKEWLGKVTRIIDDYSPAELTEDKIIETVANSMIARSGDDVPNDNDRIFFTKLLQKSEMRKVIVIELSYKGFS